MWLTIVFNLVAGPGTLAVIADADGNASYQAIVEQGHRKGTVVHSTHSAMVPKLHEKTEEVDGFRMQSFLYLA
jgi:hypothetical protein